MIEFKQHLYVQSVLLQSIRILKYIHINLLPEMMPFFKSEILQVQICEIQISKDTINIYQSNFIFYKISHISF